MRDKGALCFSNTHNETTESANESHRKLLSYMALMRDHRLAMLQNITIKQAL